MGVISVSMKPEKIKKIDDMAKSLGMNRSEMIGEAVEEFIAQQNALFRKIDAAYKAVTTGKARLVSNEVAMKRLRKAAGV